jgi:hypothetical protein
MSTVKNYSFTAEELSTVLKSVVTTFITLKKIEYISELSDEAPYQAVLSLLNDEFIEALNDVSNNNKLDTFLDKATTHFATHKN